MNLNKKWDLKIDSQVYKELKRIPKKNAIKIIGEIENLPFSLYEGDIQKIKGEKHVWRKRVGNYRIFYEIYQKNSIINIFLVERRTSKTYR